MFVQEGNMGESKLSNVNGAIWLVSTNGNREAKADH